MDAIKPLDYYIDTTAARIRAAVYAMCHRGCRAYIECKYVERRNHHFFGGVEFVDKVVFVAVVRGSVRDGSLEIVRQYYGSPSIFTRDLMKARG